jgi:predicted DNA-binding transcriptional regulator AlpA
MSTATDDQATQPDGLLSYNDLARLFRVSQVTVRSWVRTGGLPSPVRVGRRRFWTRQTIADFIRAGGMSRDKATSPQREAVAC